MATTVHVNLPERGYDIRIGVDAGIGDAWRGASKILVVSDSNVEPLHGERVRAAFAAAGAAVERAVVPAGEASKSAACALQLYEGALACGLDRDSLIVALGGGMVGDLAGFVAATFLRGIRLIQMPTTLLAMVDSSVGGKTGINLPQGKNLVGVFHQPVDVIADLALLGSLPRREYISGLAEVVKYGVIWDAAFFARLEAAAPQLLATDVGALETIIARCCEIKAQVVAMDERDSGSRAILNFGHTLAHALETFGGYKGLLHGEAVAVGMAYAAALSVRERKFPAADFERLVRLLRRLGLPITLAEIGLGAPDDGTWAALRQAMAVDKKTQGGTPRFVLCEQLGAPVIGCRVAEDTLKTVFMEPLQLAP